MKKIDLLHDKEKRDYWLSFAYITICLIAGIIFAVCNLEKLAMVSFTALCGAIGVLGGTFMRYNVPGLKRYVWLCAIIFSIAFIIGGILNLMLWKSWMIQLGVTFIALLIGLIASLVKYLHCSKIKKHTKL